MYRRRSAGTGGRSSQSPLYSGEFAVAAETGSLSLGINSLAAFHARGVTAIRSASERTRTPRSRDAKAGSRSQSQAATRGITFLRLESDLWTVQCWFLGQAGLSARR